MLPSEIWHKARCKALRSPSGAELENGLDYFNNFLRIVTTATAYCIAIRTIRFGSRVYCLAAVMSDEHSFPSAIPPISDNPVLTIYESILIDAEVDKVFDGIIGFDKYPEW